MKLSRRNFIGLTLTSGIFALYNNQIFANSNIGIQKQKVLVIIEIPDIFHKDHIYLFITL